MQTLVRLRSDLHQQYEKTHVIIIIIIIMIITVVVVVVAVVVVIREKISTRSGLQGRRKLSGRYGGRHTNPERWWAAPYQ